MAGQDQSANLGGMLTNIGKTMGSMGDAYKPVLQAATKPRGDMNDPAHLANLAQWASSNGDSAAATMYMSQARELKAEQKEAKSMSHMAMSDKATMTGDMTAEQIAESGDVTNLDRSIAALTERMQGDFPSIQARNYAKANLDRLKSMREGAVGKQTQNHARAVTAIDAQLESGVDANGNPVDQRALDAIRERKAKLLQNPEVQDTLNAEAVARGKVEREQLALEGEKYLTENVGSLREAITTGDFDEVDKIVEGADGWRAQQAVRSFADATQREVEAADERQILNEAQVVYDYKMIEEQVADLDPKLLEAAGYNVALKRVEASEAKRIGGEFKTTGHLIQAREAREAVETAIGNARMKQATTQLSADLRKDQETDEEIDKLESSLETFEPKQTNVDARVRELARGLGRKDVDSDGNPENYPALYAQARAELRNEHSAQVNARLSQLGVESEAPEAPAGSYVSDSGQSLMPNEVSEFVADKGEKAFKSAARAMGFSPEAISEMLVTDAPEAVKDDEPKMYRREPGLPRDILGLQSKYDQNVAGLASRRSPQ